MYQHGSALALTGPGLVIFGTTIGSLGMVGIGLALALFGLALILTVRGTRHQ